MLGKPLVALEGFEGQVHQSLVVNGRRGHLRHLLPPGLNKAEFFAFLFWMKHYQEAITSIPISKSIHYACKFASSEVLHVSFAGKYSTV